MTGDEGQEGDCARPARIEITDADYRSMFLPCDALDENDDGRASGPAVDGDAARDTLGR